MTFQIATTPTCLLRAVGLQRPSEIYFPGFSTEVAA
jgi:hypothetical protein